MTKKIYSGDGFFRDRYRCVVDGGEHMHYIAIQLNHEYTVKIAMFSSTLMFGIWLSVSSQGIVLPQPWGKGSWPLFAIHRCSMLSPAKEFLLWYSSFLLHFHQAALFPEPEAFLIGGKDMIQAWNLMVPDDNCDDVMMMMMMNMMIWFLRWHYHLECFKFSM